MEKKHFANFNDLRSVDIPSPPMKRQVFFGDEILIGRNVIKPHTTVPGHSHPHEQYTYVESGECDVIINDSIREHVGPGGIAWFPSNAKHELICTSDEPTVVLDIFNPVREDWLKDFED